MRIKVLPFLILHLEFGNQRYESSNDYITKAMYYGQQVDVIYTDYSKAFDRIDHNTLLHKLSQSVKGGDLLRCFES